MVEDRNGKIQAALGQIRRLRPSSTATMQCSLTSHGILSRPQPIPTVRQKREIFPQDCLYNFSRSSKASLSVTVAELRSSHCIPPARKDTVQSHLMIQSAHFVGLNGYIIHAKNYVTLFM